MVRMSRTRGMRRSVTGSAVSSAAASAGSAAFFDPPAGISPRNLVPPVMANLSMEVFAFVNGRPHIVPGRHQQLGRALRGNAGCLGNDSARPVRQLGIGDPK